MAPLADPGQDSEQTVPAALGTGAVSIWLVRRLRSRVPTQPLLHRRS